MRLRYFFLCILTAVFLTPVRGGYMVGSNGSLVADRSRGIAYITYDFNNHPQTIYFTNGNMTKYIYSATGQKLCVESHVAVPNITRPFGVEPTDLPSGSDKKQSRYVIQKILEI